MVYQTKQDKNQVYTKLKLKKEQLENDFFVIKLHEWQKLTQPERVDCYKEWDKYYKDVLNTRAFSNYKEMADAFKTRNLVKIKDLKEEAKAMLQEQLEERFQLLKPNKLNPYEFLHTMSVLSYTKVLEDTENLEKESKEMELNKIFQ